MLADRDWTGAPGASGDDLRKLIEIAPKQLPQSYLDLLRESDGGEGPLPVDPWNLCLDHVKAVIDLELDGSQKQNFPSLFVIGGNGAGEAFALDLRFPDRMPVVMYDMFNSDLEESVVEVAESFDAFLPLIGVEEK
ncbi:MAG: SMI1/KNR4 family protein [Pseudomonadota bacterium]